MDPFEILRGLQRSLFPPREDRVTARNPFAGVEPSRRLGRAVDSPEIVVVALTSGSSPALRLGRGGWRQKLAGTFGGVPVFVDDSCVVFYDEGGYMLRNPRPSPDILFVPLSSQFRAGKEDDSAQSYAYCHPDTFGRVDKSWLAAELKHVLAVSKESE